VIKYYVIIYQSLVKTSNGLNEKSSKNSSTRNVLNIEFLCNSRFILWIIFDLIMIIFTIVSYLCDFYCSGSVPPTYLILDLIIHDNLYVNSCAFLFFYFNAYWCL